MSSSNICRICLCKGVKMYSCNEFHLKSYYEEIMAKKMPNKDGLPNKFCYLCAAILYKFHKFKEKCQTADNVLKELVIAGAITTNSIKQADRHKNNLISSINVITANDRVKTYNIKTSTKVHKKAVIDIVKINIENDLDCKISGVKNEVNDVSKELIDTIINDMENNLVQIENQNLKPDNTINFDCRITEEGLVLTDVVATPISGEHKTFSDDDDDDRISNDNLVDDIDIKDTINIETNIINDDIFNNTIDDSNKTKHKRGRRPTKKAASNKSIKNINKNKDKKKILKKEKVNKPTQRRQRRFETYSSKQNVLDPEHWLKIHLSEEEAYEEHKAKANDPKYLVAAFKCTECFKGFSKEEMLIRHRKLRHDESVGNIICRFCNRRFKIKCQLSRHISQHYSKFKCLRCDLVCVLENTAQFHNEYHNGVTRKCKHCGEEFRHLSTYYTHLRSHRSEHVCTLCGASFVSVLGLNMHKRNMHVTTVTEQAEEGSIHCSRCDIMFETRKAYDEHLIHSAMHAEGVEDLVTESPMPSLPKHRRKTLRRNPRILSQCGICNKTFSTQAAYFKHHGAEHAGVPHPARPSDRVVCEICGQSLAIGSVPNHINTHTREKKFTCATCGMQFISKGSLKRHQLTHTGEKPFECSLCDKRFTQKCSMQLHYRTFHLKEPYPKRNRRKKNDTQETSLFEEYRNENNSETSLKIDRWR